MQIAYAATDAYCLVDMVVSLQQRRPDLFSPAALPALAGKVVDASMHHSAAAAMGGKAAPSVGRAAAGREGWRSSCSGSGGGEKGRSEGREEGKST
jgi:hypothetical protein